eukprot:scaffold47091_cov69-Phaeocystis_antarctica.AAC.2
MGRPTGEPCLRQAPPPHTCAPRSPAAPHADQAEQHPSRRARRGAAGGLWSGARGQAARRHRRHRRLRQCSLRNRRLPRPDLVRRRRRHLLPARRHSPPRAPKACPASQHERWRGDGADGRLCLRRHGAHDADGATRRRHQAALPPHAQVAHAAAAMAAARCAGRRCRQLGRLRVERSGRGHSGSERVVGGGTHAAARRAGAARGD